MRDWSTFQDKLEKQDCMFFAQKTAIVIDENKVQEILYKPILGKCVKEGWLGSGKLEINYKSEVVSEIAIDDILADFT